MFCDRCGATVPPEQQFCGRCGKELRGNFVPAYPSPNRVQQHARLLGILWLALSALNIVGGFAVLLIANLIFGNAHEINLPPNAPVHFLHALLSVIGMALIAKSALGLLAGWGLLQRESWARMLTIVLSFIALFNIPLGTALGIYGLWVLLPAQSEREYELAAKKAQAA